METENFPKQLRTARKKDGPAEIGPRVKWVEYLAIQPSVNDFFNVFLPFP